MNLSCPSRLLDATNQSLNLFVGRWSPREFECSCMDTPEAKRRRHPAIAAAGSGIRRQAAVCARERFDGRTGVAEALTEQLR
jgi:hypothetical protein